MFPVCFDLISCLESASLPVELWSSYNVKWKKHNWSDQIICVLHGEQSLLLGLPSATLWLSVRFDGFRLRTLAPQSLKLFISSFILRSIRHFFTWAQFFLNWLSTKCLQPERKCKVLKIERPNMFLLCRTIAKENVFDTIATFFYRRVSSVFRYDMENTRHNTHSNQQSQYHTIRTRFRHHFYSLHLVPVPHC